MSIGLIRIDDRLVHGQVATLWTKQSRANRIVIVDDGTAADSFISKMFTKLAPQGTTVEIYTIQDSIEILKKYQNDDSLCILVLTKTPEPLVAFKEGGVDFSEYIIGGMGAKPNRKKFYRNISASEEEKQQIKKLNEMGVNGYFRIIPSDKPISVMDYIK